MVPLTGVYGKGGSGKTTIVTYFLAKYLKNIKKYTNFNLHLPNTEKIDSIKLFDIPETDKPQIVIWDEAYTEMDNREFMEVRNRINSYLLFQARKNNMSIISISQLNILDLRWRNLEEHTILCNDRQIYDKNFEYYKGDFNFLISSLGKFPSYFTLKYNIAKKIFPYFDTKEKILPKNFEELKKQVLLQNPKELLKYVNETAKKINESGFVKKVTHDNVKLAMLKIGLIKDFKYEPYIYIKLKDLQKEQE